MSVNSKYLYIFLAPEKIVTPGQKAGADRFRQSRDAIALAAANRKNDNSDGADFELVDPDYVKGEADTDMEDEQVESAREVNKTGMQGKDQPDGLKTDKSIREDERKTEYEGTEIKSIQDLANDNRNTVKPAKDNEHSADSSGKEAEIKLRLVKMC